MIRMAQLSTPHLPRSRSTACKVAASCSRLPTISRGIDWISLKTWWKTISRSLLDANKLTFRFKRQFFSLRALRNNVILTRRSATYVINRWLPRRIKSTPANFVAIQPVQSAPTSCVSLQTRTTYSSRWKTYRSVKSRSTVRWVVRAVSVIENSSCRLPFKCTRARAATTCRKPLWCSKSWSRLRLRL